MSKGFIPKYLNQTILLEIHRIVTKKTFSFRPITWQEIYNFILEVNKNKLTNGEIPAKLLLTLTKACLTLNYLLFGRQPLYSSNTSSTIATNLTVFSSTTDQINRISNHF